MMSTKDLYKHLIFKVFIFCPTTFMTCLLSVSDQFILIRVAGGAGVNPSETETKPV